MAPYQSVSHLFLLVTYLTAFSLTVAASRDRNAKKQLVFALLSLGAFESLYGLIQYLTGWQQIFTYVKKYYLEDATGTYINRNHFAGFLEMILPFAVVLALLSAEFVFMNSSGPRVTVRKIFAKTELPSLALWLFLAILLFAALILSRSRMGIISAFVSIAFILIVARTASMQVRTKVAVAVIFFSAVLGLILWIGNDRVMSRFETLGQEYNLSGQNRISIWCSSFELIRHHPFLGSGLGTFSVDFPPYQTTFLNLLVDHAHCDYLEIASEIGLPGAVLVFGSICWVLVQAARQYRIVTERFDKAVCLGCVGSIVAILVHSLADFNLYIPANALVFSIILGLAWSHSYPRTATAQSFSQR